MKRLLLILLLIPSLAFGAYTEFYCGNGGSNLNSGSDAGTSVYTSTNGNWNGSTSFTPTDGSNPATASPGVSVGQFASVYLDGATVGVFIGRVTAVTNAVNGAITISSSIKAGTAPTSGATGRTIKVGGCWLGPNAASLFPMSLTSGLSSAAVSSTTKVRLNLKNDQTYTMNASVTMNAGGSYTVQGYSSSPGDGGRATIDFGTTTGILWTTSSSTMVYEDLIWSSSATSGTGALVVASTGTGIIFNRCVAHGARGAGFNATGGYDVFIECEAYDCNKSNTASIAGFTVTGAVPFSFVRCISHDNASGSNADGYFNGSTAGVTYQNCISDTNAGSGFNVGAAGSATTTILNSDSYNNTGDGIKWTGVSPPVIQNCNFIKNGGWGINVSGVVLGGTIDNCGFGSGSQANSSGTTTIAGSLTETGDVTYASGVTPWVDPANGNFKINLAAANFAGRGSFTQTAASYSGTIGYPDIGAAQSATGPTGTFSKEVSYGYSQ